MIGKLNSKYLLIGLLLIFVVGIVVACGEKKEEASQEAGVADTSKEVIEIQWWHAMGGALGERVNDIAVKFNESQDKYKVVPVYKGNYTETMTAAIAAFRAREAPHIVQVFEVGTYSMMLSGAIKPIHELMAESGLPFNQDDYIQPVITYYTNADGKMMSMPFNSSTPVMYYNKTAFEKAGLDPNKPPKTWEEVEEYARKLKEAGYCGFTTTWQSWVMLENFSAWHNVAFANKENGFKGLDAELTINGDLQVRHIQQLADWHKEGLFNYGGRRSEAGYLFINQEVAMIFDSSAGLASYKANIKDWEFGVTPLPYWSDVEDAPQNSIIGGASLWVFDGHSEEEYKAIAEFMNFLSSPEIQFWWHKETGYVPITKAAYELAKQKGYYEEEPFQEIAIQQLMNKEPTENSKGIRLGNFVQIRDVINDELEYVWNGEKTAEQALNDAVKRGNELLREFERTHKK